MEHLPDEATPSTVYGGRPRLFAPTLRSFIEKGHALSIRAIMLSNATQSHVASSVHLKWRALSDEPDAVWSDLLMPPLRVTEGAGGVWEGHIPSTNTTMIEWMLENDEGLMFPATAPAPGHSVVVRPSSVR